MIYGIFGAVFWSVSTLLLNKALGMQSTLLSWESSILGAAVHDTFSALILISCFIGKKKNRALSFPSYINSYISDPTPGSRFFITAASLLGGPVGMTCFLISMTKIGPGMTASITAVYPVLGAILSAFLLRERLRKQQLGGILLLTVCISLMSGLHLTGSASSIGFLFSGLCTISWGSEAVLSYLGQKRGNIPPELALLMRQTLSSITYCFLLVPLLGLIKKLWMVITSTSFCFLFPAALMGTLSYLLYYKSIRLIGPSKAMACNVSYTVWTLFFESILSQTVPSAFTVLCVAGIAIGTSIAVWEPSTSKKGEIIN
jgi:drug/metabolite transporter (DMT)-like permease